MQGRVTVALGCLALIVALAWFWIQPEGEEALRSGGSPKAGQAARAAVEAPGQARVGGGSSPEDAQRVAVAEQEATADLDAEPIALAPFRIRVVGVDGEPVAEAELGYWIFDPEKFRGVDAEAQAWAGPIAKTNEVGELRLALPKLASHAMVYVRSGPHWARAVLNEEGRAELTEIELTLDLRLEVRVVDSLSRPLAGVPLILSLPEHAEKQGWAFAYAESEGAEGLAVFEHFQINYPEAFAGSAVIKLNRPSAAPLYREVRLDPPPQEAVEFRVPDFGSIQCDFVDATQQPITDLPDWMGIDLYFRETGGHESLWNQNVGEAPALLEMLPVGMEYRIEVDTNWFTGGTDWFAGPTRDGEVSYVQVELEPLPRIRGRLVNEEGAPLAGYWWATGVQPDGRFYREYFETSDDGVFEAAFPADEEEGFVRKETSLVFTWSTRTQPVASYPRQQHSWQLGVNDLGDVVMCEPAPLITGRIVDEKGSAIAGATVSLAIEREVDWSVPASWVATTQSAEDGSFTLRGPAAGAQPLRLRVDRYPTVPCFVGQREVVFSIQTGAD